MFDLAAGLAVDAVKLAVNLESCKTFGALLEEVGREQRWSGAWRARNALVTVDTAIADLRQRIVRLKQMPTVRIDHPTNRIAPGLAQTSDEPAHTSNTLEEVEPVAFLAAAV